MKSSVDGPAVPPACWKPGIPGGMKCVAGTPLSRPPRVFSSARRFDAAITALRVLMLLNGGLVVFNAMYRLAPAGVSVSCFGYCVAAVFSASPVASKSKLTMLLPVRILVTAEFSSAKPSWTTILSR
jgi:hypothetical protein